MKFVEAERIGEPGDPRELFVETVTRVLVAATVSEAGYVGGNHVKVPRQQGRDQGPVILVCRKTVKHQQWIPGSSLQVRNAVSVDRDLLTPEPAVTARQHRREIEQNTGRDEIGRGGDDKQREYGAENPDNHHYPADVPPERGSKLD